MAQSQHARQELEAQGSALRACFELEELVRGLEKRARYGKLFKRCDSSDSLCSTITFLCQRGVITPRQERNLHRARKIRNRVVHYFDMSELADLKQITQEAKLALAA